MKQHKPIKKKKHLEIHLQSIPGHLEPKVELEQYSTPSVIAADILWTAYSLGDIEDKNVLDLACGTGIFAIGAKILGAREVWGIDIDEHALQTAKSIALEKGLTSRINFMALDLRKDDLDKIINLEFAEIDTIIQNPPFGSQSRSLKGSDRIFMEKSLQISPVVYSFHMAETEDFVEKYFLKFGGKITHKFFYQFPLPKIYHFHKKESKDIEVIVVRVERINNLI
ncbi:METTL5 family protein [Methanobacterium alcaliphilum]|uniref:METTL5 family protein n=1 Tax=Methanobacterium alcaliphilum TaxID=392018 RepID=UPI00200AAA95|nr:METTL5 family protein [Methanobacterium alcaliphilum]MCK9151308.1 METTL5 family protein [Methanobacterium alcaliphilum]